MSPEPNVGKHIKDYWSQLYFYFFPFFSERNTSTETCPHFRSVLIDSEFFNRIHLIISLCAQKKASIIRWLIASTAKRKHRKKKPQLHIPSWLYGRVPNINISSFCQLQTNNASHSALTTQHIFAILLQRFWLVDFHHPIFRCTHSHCETRRVIKTPCLRLQRRCVRMSFDFREKIWMSRARFSWRFVLSHSWMKCRDGAHVTSKLCWLISYFEFACIEVGAKNSLFRTNTAVRRDLLQNFATRNFFF